MTGVLDSILVDVLDVHELIEGVVCDGVGGSVDLGHPSGMVPSLFGVQSQVFDMTLSVSCCIVTFLKSPISMKNSSVGTPNSFRFREPETINL